LPGEAGTGGRTSPINCLGDSSMQTTGCKGSNGRLLWVVLAETAISALLL
jgi:hypothetical protein